MKNEARIGTLTRPPRRKHLFLRIAALLLLLLLPILAVNRRVGNYAAAACKSHASLAFGRDLNRAMQKELQNGMLAYDTLIQLTFDPSGQVVSLSANMPALLSLRAAVCRDVYEDFLEEKQLHAAVPIGSLSGIDMFSGKGASLSLSITPARTFRAYFASEFSESGINQTLHRILFCAEADYTLLLPTGKRHFTVKETFCVAETILLGTVPDAYTKINRLTDDLTETDIDDIYDFGAQAD